MKTDHPLNLLDDWLTVYLTEWFKEHHRKVERAQAKERRKADKLSGTRA